MATMVENAFSLWLWPLHAARLGADAIETTLAGQQVIGARLPTMVSAMRAPLMADHVELSRMVTEKVTAFGISGKSASRAGDVVRRASTANARAMGTMACGGALWPAEWIRLTEHNLAACAALAALPAAMLRPIHGSVVANEKRLRR
jgi:hypothetical protein